MIEKELDTIRLKLYEATKHMTPDERIAFIKAKAAPAIKKYNMRVVGKTEPDKTKVVV
jgi:hypothetical protein